MICFKLFCIFVYNTTLLFCFFCCCFHQLYLGLPNVLSSTYYRGLYVFVLNSTDYPLGSAISPYLVTPGSGLAILPQRQFYTQYQTPYSECNVLEDNTLAVGNLPDSTFFDGVVNTGYAYAQSTCFSFCQQKITAQKCHCIALNIAYTIDGYDYCLNENETRCADMIFDNFTSSSFITQNCLLFCPLECTQRILIASISSYTYPSTEAYLGKIQNNANLIKHYANQTDFTTNLRRNVVQVILNYNSLSYTETDEEPKLTTEDLLGLIGGHLHLFLGMSLISFVELGELIILTGVFVCNKNKL